MHKTTAAHVGQAEGPTFRVTPGGEHHPQRNGGGDARGLMVHSVTDCPDLRESAVDLLGQGVLVG